MKIAVFTTIFGTDTDPLHEPRVRGDCDYLCFTDQPFADQLSVPSTSLAKSAWRRLWTPTKTHPCHQSRMLKIAAECVAHYDASLWIDAAFELLIDPAELIDHLFHCDVLALRHPDRDLIIHEGRAIVATHKAPADLIAAQIRAYGSWPRTQRTLTTTGFLFRRHCARVRNFNRKWAKLFEGAGHTRDQMSVDYAAYKTGTDIRYLSGHYRDNPYARFHPCPTSNPQITRK